MEQMGERMVIMVEYSVYAVSGCLFMGPAAIKQVRTEARFLFNGLMILQQVILSFSGVPHQWLRHQT